MGASPTNFLRARSIARKAVIEAAGAVRLPRAAFSEPVDLSISDAAALSQWHHAVRRTFWARDLPIVTFELPGLSALQNQSTTARARELQRACGCASSGLLMTVAVVCLTVAHLTSASASLLPTGTWALGAIGWILAAGALGKVTGIFWARWRLLQLASNLLDAIGVNTTGMR